MYYKFLYFVIIRIMIFSFCRMPNTVGPIHGHGAMLLAGAGGVTMPMKGHFDVNESDFAAPKTKTITSTSNVAS